MRQHSKPPLVRKERRTPRRIYIVPFFTDKVKPDGDLFRFVAPVRMTLKAIIIRIDKLEGSPILFSGGIQSGANRAAISQPVNVGENLFLFDHSVLAKDVLILNFDDKERASKDVFGITISIHAER